MTPGEAQRELKRSMKTAPRPTDLMTTFPVSSCTDAADLADYTIVMRRPANRHSVERKIDSFTSSSSDSLRTWMTETVSA